MESNGTRSRVETGILTFDKLSEEQQACADRVVALIDSIAKEPDPGPKPHAGRSELRLPLDASRRSQVVLIDGERGSGKTTLLLSLLRGWEERDKAKPTPPGEKRTAVVEAGGPTVIPVPIVDLHPMPPRSNLAMALLGRLQWIAQHLAAPRKDSGRANWRREEGDSAEAVGPAWKDLVASVARWYGGAEERRPQVDAEEYTRELEEEAELARSTDTRFRNYVDAILTAAGGAQDNPKRRPLLLLPIDDADMNPHRATELLELLRTFYHPRLAYLLTGHSELFLSALRAHYLEALCGAKHQVSPAPMLIRAVDPGIYAVQLATEVYDRVIPAAHRIEMLPTATSMFEFKFDDTAVGNESLADLFRRVTLYADPQVLTTQQAPDPSGERPPTLKDLFEARLAPGSSSVRRLQSALPDRFRDSVDMFEGLRFLLEHPSVEGQPHAVERVLLFLWNWAVTHETAFPKTKEQLRRILRVVDSPLPDSTGQIDTVQIAESKSPRLTESKIKPMLLLACEDIQVTREYRELFRYTTSALGMTVALRSRARTQMVMWPPGMHHGRIDEVSRAWLFEQELPFRLSERAVANLKLAVDVIAARAPMNVSIEAIHGATGFIGESITPGEFEGSFVRVNYYSKRLKRNLRFVWRVPRWNSFREFELFQRLWESYAPSARTPEHLARVFCALAIAVSRRQAVDEVIGQSAYPGGDEASQPTSLVALIDTKEVQIAWRAIKRMGSEEPGTRRSDLDSRSTQVISHWCREVLPAFAAPESGLDKETADAIWDELPDQRSITGVAFERRRHLRAVVAAADGTDRGKVPPPDVKHLEDELREQGFAFDKALPPADDAVVSSEARSG